MVILNLIFAVYIFLISNTVLLSQISNHDSADKSQMSTTKLQSYLSEIGLPFDSITAITPGFNNEIWIGCSNGLWLIENDQSREYTYKDGLFNKNIQNLYYSKEGVLWAATPSGPFVLLDNHFYVFEPLRNKNVLSISEDSNNWVFLTKEGLMSFEKEGNYYKSTLFQIAVTALILLLIVVIFYWLANKYKRNIEWKTNLLKVEQHSLLLLMNPHFIFNSLNSVQRYIMDNDKEAAHNYLQKFASMMRKVLENSSQPTIALSEEIAQLELYLQIESQRFDDGFDFEIDVKDAELWQIEIPTMLLQPFVENAVWHGLMNKEIRGKISIRFSKLDKKLIMCEIEDNGIGRKQAAAYKSKEQVKHKSKGTEIVKRRIELLNMKAAQKISCTTFDLEEKYDGKSGTLVRLEIPILLS